MKNGDTVETILRDDSRVFLEKQTSNQKNFMCLIMKATLFMGGKVWDSRVGRKHQGVYFGLFLHGIKPSHDSLSSGGSAVKGNSAPGGSQHFPSLGACD